MASSLITLNLDFIEAQYAKWRSDPGALADDWRFFFEGFELAGSGRADPASFRAAWDLARQLTP